jgi:hypothetical protein
LLPLLGVLAFGFFPEEEFTTLDLVERLNRLGVSLFRLADGVRESLSSRPTDGDSDPMAADFAGVRYSSTVESNPTFLGVFFGVDIIKDPSDNSDASCLSSGTKTELNSSSPNSSEDPEPDFANAELADSSEDPEADRSKDSWLDLGSNDSCVETGSTLSLQ